MKKTVFKVLAIILALSLTCLPAFAAEGTSSPTNAFETREQLLEKAMLAFPEYAEEIARDAAPAGCFTETYSAQEPTIIVDETRAISENESIHITKYSNGITLLASLDARRTITSSSSSAGYTNITLNAQMTCLGSYDRMMVDGVKCRWSDQTADNYIVSIGSASPASTTMVPPTFSEAVYSGTAASPAYAAYLGSFWTTEALTGISGPLTFTLEINGFGNVRGY